MNKDECKKTIQEFRGKIESYRKLLLSSRDSIMPNIVRNHGEIDQQKSELNSIYGGLENYIKKLGKNPKINDGVWNIWFSPYDNAFTSDTLVRIGPSIEATLGDLDYILGKIKSMTKEDWSDLFEQKVTTKTEKEKEGVIIENGKEKNNDYEYDAFISYASEDSEIVNPLAKILKTLGLRIWFDKFELEPGDSITEGVGRGLARSNYGIIILSEYFINKDYPKHELRGLIDKAIYDNKLLPVWHKISRDKIKEFHPSLVDIMAIKSEIGVEIIAQQLAQVIKPQIFKTIGVFKKVKLSHLRPGPIRHRNLPIIFIERIKNFKKILSDVDTTTIDDTIDSFKRDFNPGREIEIWEAIAEVYDDFVNKNHIKELEKKKEVYSILLKASLGKLKEDDYNELNYLKIDDANKIESSYRNTRFMFKKLSAN